MAASIRAGVRALPQAGPAMIVPADMPALGEADLLALIAAQDAQPGKILRGAAQGRPGHPVIFPPDLIGVLQALTGDEGARGVIAVSYTHLDVYKRQPSMWCISAQV